MSLQWTLVAGFLYGEMIVAFLFLLPISASRWQKVFRSTFMRSLAARSAIIFYTFIISLILLFMDAVREVRKYSADQKEVHHEHVGVEMQVNMKLFRAQRNFYISMFALFFCFVLQRLMTLISAHATLEAEKSAAMSQAKSASDTAEKLLSEQDKKEKDAGAMAENKANETHDEKMRQLEKELEETREELGRAKKNVESMEAQARSVSDEYDRLLQEHEVLQRKIEQEDKKDD